DYVSTPRRISEKGRVDLLRNAEISVASADARAVAVTRRATALLALATLVALLPFLAKPLHIDDPLFVCSARQIRAHPSDPFGFQVNWYGTAMPLHAVTKNPPLGCYYLAAASVLLGWSEMALHAAILLLAVAAIVGTYLLARELVAPRAELAALAALAALLTLASPVFLISATTLMCDVPMLCLWV